MYVSEGFSAMAAERIAKPQRVSTMILYQSRWKQILKWGSSENKHPAECTFFHIMDYLVHLSVTGLGPDAIEGQCAAIVPVINSLVGTLYDSSKDELFLSYFAVYAGTNPQHVWVS